MCSVESEERIERLDIPKDDGFILTRGGEHRRRE
jgi:hypothetical protein